MKIEKDVSDELVLLSLYSIVLLSFDCFLTLLVCYTSSQSHVIVTRRIAQELSSFKRLDSTVLSALNIGLDREASDASNVALIYR